MPHSNLVEKVGEALIRYGYVKSVEKRGKKAVKDVVITLSMPKGIPTFKGARRVSKPSRRVYIRSTAIKPVKSGRGILVLSTTKGILSGREAKEAKIGGEALFEIW